MTLDVGQMAPDFSLPSTQGNNVTLADFKGQNLVLFFYPKDDTPGCTLESCGFRDHYDEFKRLNTEIIGVSRDSLGSHQRFQEKYQLPFALLSDQDGVVCGRYDVLKNKGLLTDEPSIQRSTFVIDPQGIIQHIWRNVEVGGHLPEVMACVQKLSDANA